MVPETTGIDLGDLPVPTEPRVEKRVADTFDYNVAFNLAFVGVGQCGGRIAATFQQLGYVRVCAINTTIQDLNELKLPARCKLDVGAARGAGKDPRIAAALVADKGEDIFDLYKRCWGNEVDYAFVCFAAAGGTGAGAFPKVVEVARRYMQDNHRPVKVGAIVALPKDAEGQRYARNAVETISRLRTAGLSPVIIIDNQKIKELFPRTPPGQEHARCNQSTAQLLHLFNRLAGSDSEHTTFDRADFARLLDSGCVAFGAHTLTKWKSEIDISMAIREQLRQNILAAVELGQGQLAGLIYVLNGTTYDSVPTDYLDHGAEMLTRMLHDNSTVLQGIYRGVAGKDSIHTLVMVGGLPWPAQRAAELARAAGISPEEEILGG